MLNLSQNTLTKFIINYYRTVLHEDYAFNVMFL